jgi:hypothetical protein
MLSIKPLCERKLLIFLIVSILATLFHYTAIIMIFLWFLNPKKINTQFYVLLIIASYLINQFSSMNISEIQKYIQITAIQNKLLAYEYAYKSTINVFNLWQIMRTVLSFLFLWKSNLIQENNKYGILLIKLYILTTCTFVILAANPTFAVRISDLLAITDIILIPCIIYIIKPEFIAKLIVAGIGFTYLFLNLFYNKIIT